MVGEPLPKSEEQCWERVKSHLKEQPVRLGRHWSYNILNDPKRLVFVLSRYKFAAKLIGEQKRILELGCSEGLGTAYLGEFATSVTGVDSDASAIETARRNWPGDKFTFIGANFLGRRYGRFDAVVSLDVIEHLDPAHEELFFQTVCDNLSQDGLCILGTPNVTAASYASEASKEGHINLYSGERLVNVARRFFRNVHLFGSNDEVVHTGFVPMMHYLVVLASGKRKGVNRCAKTGMTGRATRKRVPCGPGVEAKADVGSPWEKVKLLMGARRLEFGSYLSYILRQSPRRLLFSLSYYKFAAKMIGQGKRVLDIGCGEGLGTWLLAKECGFAEGINLDGDLIRSAMKNWPTEESPNLRFRQGNFLDARTQRFDAVVCLDVIEHILPENAQAFLRKLVNCLASDGIALIGTPNMPAQKYASEVSRAGHVNLYDQQRLRKELEQVFARVFMFGANDEVVHTGFHAMAQYLIALCCR